MISHGAAGLLLDPGLGKTTITYAAFKVLQEQKLIRRALVVAPLRVCYNVWPKESKKWAPFEQLKIHVLHDKGKTYTPPAADIYVINPEGLEWLIAGDGVRGLGLDMLIVDESTMFKHSNTKRFKLLRQVLKLFRRRYILTGTPTPNGLIDLFGQIYILDEGNALGRYITHYRTNYFYPSGYGGYVWTAQADALERITKRIAPLTLRMAAKDYLELPERVVQDIVVQLPDSARAVYRQMENQLVAQLENHEVIADNAAVASGKCRQIANGALYTYDDREVEKYNVVHTAKLEALKEFLDSMSGQPVLILHEFTFERDMIVKALEIPYLGKNAKQDSLLIDKFNAGQLPALLGQPQSMAHGLNLQGSCAHVCWYGITWNLEHYEQAIQRVLRQGNTNKRVIVHHIVAEDTIDETIISVLKQKDKTQSALLSALKRLRS